ncbi:MAG: sugar ABC transporter substrate-binding protein [Spirochaetia bacterium]|nr:sugar ABC transporter substrate-binding protein [Spirochaetia bacterium]
MKKMKALLLLTAVIMLLPMALGAGGQNEAQTSAEEQGVLNYYWNPDHLYNIYDQVINEFALENGYAVSSQILNWGEFQTKITADFAAGTVPDLIEVPSPWIAGFAAKGFLEDLTEQITSHPSYEDFFESTWTEVSYGESLYGMKLHHTCFGLFYNKDHFAEVGISPPETLEEMVEVIDIIDRELGPDIQAFGFDPTGQYLIPFLASEETPYLIEDGKSALDTPVVRKTIKTLQGAANSGKVFVPDPGSEDTRGDVRILFLTGKISMMISGPWEIGNIKNNYPDLNYGLVMVPHLAEVKPLTLTAGTGLAIPKGSKLPVDKTFELMTRLTSVNTEVAATLEAGMLMPRASWAADPRVAEEKAVQLFGKILPYATPFDIDVQKVGLPEITWGGTVFTKLYQKMLYTDKSMDAALDEYIKETNRLLN